MSNKVIAVLGIGTNLGDKIDNIKRAIDQVKACNIEVVSQSKVYQTPPWGFESTEDFYNMAIKIETQLHPLQLLIELKAIELQMGRAEKRGNSYTSRIIDLDILDYQRETIDLPELVIPHAHLSDRNFVLFPLRDIMPEYRHPKTNQKIDDLIEKLKDESIAVVNI